MSIAWADLKKAIKANVFPTGEAPNLVAAHDKSFVDCMIDLQMAVDCLQVDNTSLYPQCATFYNCGLTVFDAPRGFIKKVSVLGQKTLSNQTTSGGSGGSTGTASSQIADVFIPPKGKGYQGSDILAIFDPPPPVTVIAKIAQAGPYTLQVNQVLGVAADGTGPQFVRTTLTYTDQNGQLQSATPAPDCTWGTSTTGSVTVQCAANSQVNATIEVTNVPFTDGGYTIEVIVTSLGSTGGNNGSNNPVTTGDPEFCSEIVYNQVDPCLIHNYLRGSRARGCCLSIPLFFGLDPLSCGGRSNFPVPTDQGLPAGLPLLPLGFHYPQTSTDKQYRSQMGIWAIERGKIYIAPWINSNETVLVMWDGIKRQFGDADQVDDDPLLAEALEAWVRFKHAGTFDHDYEAEANAKDAYYGSVAMPGARQKLVHNCIEENRTRGCESSRARGSVTSVVSLFYNDAQTATATCPTGSTGNSVSVTIPAGTVGSNISVADANTKAKAQALTQAQAQLVCTPTAQTYTNDAQTANVSCVGEPDAPTPEGQPVSVTVPAGTVTSTVSKADANAKALALAQSQASDKLACKFWNAPQTYTATCPNNQAITNTQTVAAHTYSSTLSQADADQQALTAATNAANNAINCPGGGGTFYSTQQVVSTTQSCGVLTGGPNRVVQIIVTVVAGFATSIISQYDANQKAYSQGAGLAAATAQQYCSQGKFGTYNITL